MKKYSKVWKEEKGTWVQEHTNSNGDKIYRIHYLENDTEYAYGEFYTRKSAEDQLKIIGRN